MAEGWIGWALMVGLAIGGALVWFAVGRIPRSSEDISTAERAVEAAQIANLLKRQGVRLTPDQVDEVLTLHADYLEHGPPAA